MDTKDTAGKPISLGEFGIEKFQALIDASRPPIKDEQDLILQKAKAHDLIGRVVGIMDGHQDDWFISICSNVHFPCLPVSSYIIHEIEEEHLELLEQCVKDCERVSWAKVEGETEEEIKERDRAYDYVARLFYYRLNNGSGILHENHLARVPKCLLEEFKKK